MFYLSLCLGGLFLVLLHHLFDASWSVPIRRIEEHLGCLLPIMAALFLPIALFRQNDLSLDDRGPEHGPRASIQAAAFYGADVLCRCGFVFRSLVPFVEPPALLVAETGCDRCRRLHAQAAVPCGLGDFCFRYHVDAGRDHVDEGAATSMVLDDVWRLLFCRQRLDDPRHDLRHRAGLEALGAVPHASDADTFLLSRLVAVRVHRVLRLRPFSQYFIIWNANMPEETFWYVLREKGTWFWDIGMVIIFGHFFVPFLALLRIDVKLKLPVMIPLCIWAWLMHFCDLSFNIMPIPHPDGFVLHWLDLACMAFIGGVLAKIFLAMFAKHPVYPLRDPRLKEALTSHEIPPAEATVH